MRRYAALLLAACVLSCAPERPRPVQQAFVPPPPAPPPLRAPVCPRPDEAQAIKVSALVSQLQVLAVSCTGHDADYNADISRWHPVLAQNERVLRSFFARAYGRRAQVEHDNYITTLANLQSDQDLRSGNQLCRFYGGMFREVQPLTTSAQLAAYVQSHPIQQGLEVDHCVLAQATVVRKKGPGRRVVSRRTIKKRVVRKAPATHK